MSRVLSRTRNQAQTRLRNSRHLLLLVRSAAPLSRKRYSLGEKHARFPMTVRPFLAPKLPRLCSNTGMRAPSSTFYNAVIHCTCFLLLLDVGFFFMRIGTLTIFVRLHMHWCIFVSGKRCCNGKNTLELWRCWRWRQRRTS